MAITLSQLIAQGFIYHPWTAWIVTAIAFLILCDAIEKSGNKVRK